MSANEFLPWVRRAAVSSARAGMPAPIAATNESTDSPADLQRRTFIQLLGIGGLVIAFGPGGARRLDAAEPLPGTAASQWSPHVYVRVDDDGTVTIICLRSEMGQGIRTTMPMIIADEMEADWARCRVEQAVGDLTKALDEGGEGDLDFLQVSFCDMNKAYTTVKIILNLLNCFIECIVKIHFQCFCFVKMHFKDVLIEPGRAAGPQEGADRGVGITGPGHQDVAVVDRAGARGVEGEAGLIGDAALDLGDLDHRAAEAVGAEVLAAEGGAVLIGRALGQRPVSYTHLTLPTSDLV